MSDKDKSDVCERWSHIQHLRDFAKRWIRIEDQVANLKKEHCEYPDFRDAADWFLKLWLGSTSGMPMEIKHPSRPYILAHEGIIVVDFLYGCRLLRLMFDFPNRSLVETWAYQYDSNPYMMKAWDVGDHDEDYFVTSVIGRVHGCYLRDGGSEIQELDKELLKMLRKRLVTVRYVNRGVAYDAYLNEVDWYWLRDIDDELRQYRYG
jgi:hypothetical protein